MYSLNKSLFQDEECWPAFWKYNVVLKRHYWSHLAIYIHNWLTASCQCNVIAKLIVLETQRLIILHISLSVDDVSYMASINGYIFY